MQLTETKIFSFKMSHREDAIPGSLHVQRMHIGYLGASSSKKSHLGHFAQQEYFKYSAWILVAVFFYFKWLLLWDYVISSWRTKCNSVSEGKHRPAQTTSWLFWQFKFSHFKAWKLHYCHPISGCSLVTRIEKNVPNEHQSGGLLAVLSKVE